MYIFFKTRFTRTFPYTNTFLRTLCNTLNRNHEDLFIFDLLHFLQDADLGVLLFFKTVYQLNFVMAPSAKRVSQNQNLKRHVLAKKSQQQSWWQNLRRDFSLTGILLDPQLIWVTATALFIFEIVLNIFIINRVKCEFIVL